MKLLQTYQSSWAEHGIHPIFDSLGPLNWVRFALITLHQNCAPIMISSGEDELAVVILSGVLSAHVANHSWTHLGGRLTVFEGPATTVYVPRDAQVRLEAESRRVEVAVCRTPSEQAFQPFVIGPLDVAIQQRGCEQWHREVRNILGAGVAGSVARLILGETIQKAGQWSGYPPHKHDTEHGEQENIFEEVYHYRLDPPNGFAVQVHYGARGFDDHAYLVHNGDSFAIPSGYHPAVVQGGYRLYYLWVMAGPFGRDPHPFEDPKYRWVEERKLSV